MLGQLEQVLDASERDHGPQRYVTVTSADKRDAIERAFGQQVGNMLPTEAEDPRILVEK